MGPDALMRVSHQFHVAAEIAEHIRVVHCLRIVASISDITQELILPPAHTCH